MILICGIPSETPLAKVREQLDELAVPYVLFNQRHFAKMDMALDMAFEIAAGQLRGCLEIAGSAYRLEDFTGVYTRLMDDQQLPELEGQPADSPLRRHCRALHETLARWCEITPASVVNRSTPMGSNSSKPYQAQLIRTHGFAVPETLITNNPAEVRVFWEGYQRIIYKSMSGVRSIVQMLDEEDLTRLERIRWCPTQFQVFVEGVNVRVHTIGATLFATAIHTEAADYRYAERQGNHAELQAIELPKTLAERCTRLSQALGLAFAGIDLKITPDNQVYCFEVNPSPAFSYYEAHTAQPIARAVARYLAGMMMDNPL